MKTLRALVVLLMLFLFIGCAGMNASVPVNVATDVAFVLALQNNPSYKVPVVAALNQLKVVLSGELTYDELIAQITALFGGKYAYIGIILQGYIDTDKPIFTTNMTLFAAYKEAVIKKIDRLILLAGSV